MFSQNGEETSYNGPTNLGDLCFQVHLENYALRALGMLLSTANLSALVYDEFLPNSPGNREKKDLQHGLSLLIELCLANQEKMLDGYARHYQESDEWRLKTASTLIQYATTGQVGCSHSARQKLLEAISLLDQIIAGDDIFKPAAVAIRQQALQHSLLKETVQEVAQ